jgi:hypothetical protein
MSERSEEREERGEYERGEIGERLAMPIAMRRAAKCW